MAHNKDTQVDQMGLLNLISALGVLIVGLTLGGCSTLRDPNAVTAIGDNGSRVVVTQADKRAIFTYDSREKAYACPEPSPDVKADIEATVKALLDVSAKLPDSTSATAKAELDTTRKLVTAALLQRSQGLQVLRDMLFQACLANLRKDMSPQQYNTFITTTLPKLTSTLIATEMLSKQEQGKTAFQGNDLEQFLKFVLLNQ